MPEDGPEEIGLSRLTVARFEFHLFCAQRCLVHPFAEAHAREGALGEVPRIGVHSVNRWQKRLA